MLGKRAARANEAAEWFLLLKDDEVTDQDLSRWLEWCTVPENLREFQRTRAAWRAFGELGPAAAEMLETLLTESETAPRQLPANPVQERAPWRGARGLAWAAALAASLGAVIVGMWYAREGSVLDDVQQRIAQQPVIQSSVLPDGSLLTLAPRTEVDVSFNEVERKLELSHGEAFFKVHADKSKPFVVHTAGFDVIAVGTAFDIRSRAERVVVTVTEGIVEVARVDSIAAKNAGKWRVNAGHQLAYDVRTGAARIAAVNAERALTWREGRLQYFSEPLGSVVDDVSRYSGRRIEIGDESLAELTFTGTVFTGSVDDWLAAVESTFPIRAVVGEDHSVLLMSRSETDSSR